MRHRVHGRRLSRDTAHRNALRRNMIADLITHEQVLTTEAKARMLRPAAERVITIAKRGLADGQENPATTIHARRIAATRMARYRSYEDDAGDRIEINALQKLFDEIAPRYVNRPGGYTRLVKIGKRSGDNAKMAVLMLVEDE